MDKNKYSNYQVINRMWKEKKRDCCGTCMICSICSGGSTSFCSCAERRFKQNQRWTV